MPMLTETIMKSSKVSRITISVSLVAIIGLLTYNWAVSPQASYLQAAQHYETVSLDVEKKAKIIGTTVRRRKSKLEKLRAEINSSSVSFFSPRQADDFFDQLEKISDAANCDLKSVVFEKETIITLDKKDPKADRVTEKMVTIKVLAAYPAVIDLTAALKEYPHSICISNLQIQSNTTDTNKLSCSMKLKVYLTEDKELLSDE